MRKDRFLILWVEKNAFETKKVNFKRSKNEIFLKKVSPWFLSPLLDILDKKVYFLDQKSEGLKKSKNGNVLEGLFQGFCQNIETFEEVF